MADTPVFNNVNFTGEGTFLDPQSAKTGLAICLTAYTVYGLVALAIAVFQPHKNNKDAHFFITARNSQSLLFQIGSWFASAMGAWTLYGPASLVSDPSYGTGIIGLLVYSIGTGAPLVMLAYMGASVRANVPQATSVGSYAEFRFGKVAQLFVLLIVLITLSLNLMTEYIAIAGIFQTFFGCSPYVPLITVGIITMIYTSVGGLYVSIRTDFLQTIVVLVLTLGTVIYLGVTYAGHPLGPLPGYLGATSLGWQTLATLMIPFICGTFYGEGFWQRIWSAEDNKALKLGAWIGGGLASVVVFILGFGGILAYWSGRASADSLSPTNSNYAFFYAFADPASGSINTAVIVIILLFATIMDESAVDNFQNAIGDTLATVCIFFGLNLNLLFVRILVLVANIPLMIGAAYLAANNVSILNAFGLTNMLVTLTFAPLAAGLIPALNNYLTAFSALASCLLAFISSTVYAREQYGDIYTGMTALWWTSSYDYIAFLVAFFSSIAAIPICIIVEMTVRKMAGWPMVRFDPSYLREKEPKGDPVDAVGVALVKRLV
ncbi:hypothetical protein BC830DRAFT_1243317 [Chytriomyces sp. MP71]|nr:hypothetical protein BC830DRAFT_1243317 [Chytriomyces sp. MP71]